MSKSNLTLLLLAVGAFVFNGFILVSSDKEVDKLMQSTDIASIERSVPENENLQKIVAKPSGKGRIVCFVPRRVYIGGSSHVWCEINRAVTGSVTLDVRTDKYSHMADFVRVGHRWDYKPCPIGYHCYRVSLWGNVATAWDRRSHPTIEFRTRDGKRLVRGNVLVVE
jgi:hypothetical protein